MAIYIKGVEMPKCCADCDHYFRIAIGCDKWKNGKFNFTKERPDDCPLVYIPEPHGRLIDADALAKYYCKYCVYGDAENCDMYPCFFLYDLEEAPTVIERSE